MASHSARGSAGSTSGSTSPSGRPTAPAPTARRTRSAKTGSYGALRTDGWIVPRSGLTSAPSTDARGEAESILSALGSPASPSPSPASGAALTTPATSGPRSGESSPSPNPQLSFWKMCLEACRISTMSSCPSYKAWATPLRRDSLRRLKSVRRIGGSAYSSLPWPTPDTAPEAPNKGANVKRWGPEPSLGGVVKNIWATPKVATGSYQYSSGDHSKLVLNLEGQAQMWATPSQRDYKDGSSWAIPDSEKCLGSPPLGRHAPRSGIGGPKSSPDGPTSPRRLKTPHGAANVDHSGKMGGGGEFHKQAVNWQTPRTGDHGVPGEGKGHGGQPKGLRLNPRFVEWLMGLPPGYSNFAPLATLSCLPKPPMPSEC